MSVQYSYRDFFLKPSVPRQRRYEILRARFVERRTIKEIAKDFGVTFFTAQSMIRDFKNGFDNKMPYQFFLEPSRGPKKERKKAEIREHVLRLRARGYASTDIHKALCLARFNVSLSLIDHVLREQGLTGLAKRSQQQIEHIAQEIHSQKIPGLTIPPKATPQVPKVSDVRMLNIHEGYTLRTPLAGIFLFIPFLVEAMIDAIVNKANMVGTKMIPAVSYLLSLISLKLLDKERKSHITDWNFDEGLGLFAGLNILPKTTACTDYSYRLVNNQHNDLLLYWVKAVYPILCPEGASTFALDFHPIPHRGKNTGLENHYVPSMGKAQPSVLCCFARTIESPMLCYANADITNEDKSQMVVRFVHYWEDVTGMKPDWLYFDSKMTTYEELNHLNTNSNGKIHFITIRRRGISLVDKILDTPDVQWKNAVIDTPQRRHQKIKYLDTMVQLSQYKGKCRQIAVQGLGRATPTLFLTNNEDISGREAVLRYTQRNYIENDIGINVNFFHMDALSSEVRLNVSLDVVLTTIANGCYRWLAQNLKGHEKMEPKLIYRKFIETPGTICVRDSSIDITFDRRSHNPIIAQAHLDANTKPIPWIENKKIKFCFS